MQQRVETLSLHRLKDVLDYNPHTGLFRWKQKVADVVVVGSIAGKKPNGVHWYSKISIDGVQYAAHRLAWFYVYGEWPSNGIDHINHNKMDNRITNLRDVGHEVNIKNLGVNVNNKSGHTGVVWEKRKQKWQASINIKGSTKFLGYYDTIEDAAEARRKAQIKYGYHRNHGVDIPLDFSFYKQYHLTGVTFDKFVGQWRVVISKQHIGYFPSYWEAACAERSYNLGGTWREFIDSQPPREPRVYLPGISWNTNKQKYTCQSLQKNGNVFIGYFDEHLTHVLR